MIPLRLKSDHIIPLLKTFQQLSTSILSENRNPYNGLQSPIDMHTLYIPLTASSTVPFIHSAPLTMNTSPFLNKAVSHIHWLFPLPGMLFSIIHMLTPSLYPHLSFGSVRPTLSILFKWKQPPPLHTLSTPDLLYCALLFLVSSNKVSSMRTGTFVWSGTNP